MFNGRNQEYGDLIIKHGGFWCDVDIEEFQRQRAIPMNIPQEMIKAALVAAMQGLDLDLNEVEQRHRANNINSAEAIPGNLINGENYAQILYKKAVFARAKAELLPEFNTLSARDIHVNREFVAEQKSLLAEATFAVRSLKGKRRGGVWLI